MAWKSKKNKRVIVSKIKNIKVAGGIILNKNHFLLCRRGPKEKAAGMWEFPGGKLEKDETPEDCMVRELKEELAIDVKLGPLYTNYTYKTEQVTYDLYFFFVKSYVGKIRKIVHDKIKWLTLEEFNDYEILPGDGPLIEQLLRVEGIDSFR